jgi:hypothetical protein
MGYWIHTRSWACSAEVIAPALIEEQPPTYLAWLLEMCCTEGSLGHVQEAHSKVGWVHKTETLAASVS